jgi:hypothetical protein
MRGNDIFEQIKKCEKRETPSMNVYAKRGFKVIVTEGSAERGHDSDVAKITNLLEVGKVYTIDYTRVYPCHTTVRLEEVPGVDFNSVNFIDFSPKQSEADDKKHSDWPWIGA